MLIVAGIIHLLPLSGVLGGERLGALYGVTLSDPNLLILMRHRAVLFGLLGAFLLLAAFRPAWHGPALCAAAISVLSFLLLAASSGTVNAAIGRVVVADVIAAAALAAGCLAHLLARRHRAGRGIRADRNDPP